MTTATNLPFRTNADDFHRDPYTTARGLRDDLDAFNGAGTEQLSDAAMEQLFDYLNQYADYAHGVWEGTDATLSIDTIDGDDFTDMLEQADAGNLE